MYVSIKKLNQTISYFNFNLTVELLAQLVMHAVARTRLSGISPSTSEFSIR